MDICRTRREEGQARGIRQMRKKEEGDRAFVDNKIPCFMHKDRSHLHDFNVSLMESTSFNEYQRMIQEQIFMRTKYMITIFLC